MAAKKTKLTDAQNICVSALNDAVDNGEICRADAEPIISKCKAPVK